MKTLHPKSLVLSLLTCGTLAACGGGGSSESSGGNGNVPIDGGNTFAKTIISIDECGNETPAQDVTVLIHKDDFSVAATLTPDSSGTVRYDTEDATTTFSVISTSKALDSGAKPLVISTSIDYPKAEASNVYIYSSQESACNCQDVYLTISTPNNSDYIQSASITGHGGGYSYTHNIGGVSAEINVCQVDGQWPTLTSTINFDGHEAYFGTKSDYITDPNWYISTTGDLVSVTSNGLRNSLTAYKNGKALYQSNANAGELLTYYGVDGITNVGISTNQYEFFNNEQGSVFTYGANNKIVGTSLTNLSILLGDFDAMRIIELLFSESNSYDLSDYTELDYLRLGLEFENAFGDSLVSWRIKVPPVGTVPNIENFPLDEYLTSFLGNEEVTSAEFLGWAIAYEHLSNYQETFNIDIAQTDEEKLNREFFYASVDVSLENLTNVIPQSLTNISRLGKSSKASSQANKRQPEPSQYIKRANEINTRH